MSHEQFKPGLLPRGAMLAASLAASAYLLSRLPHMPSDGRYGGLVILWLASIVLYLAAMLPHDPMKEASKLVAWVSANRWHVTAMAVLTLVALALRAWKISTIPFTLQGDEALLGTQSQYFITGDLRNPFITGYLSYPNMALYLGSFLIRLMGPTITAIRLPWAFAGAVTIPLVFLLVRRLNGQRMAYTTAALVAIYHFHIHYSRLNINNVADPLFMALALIFLHRALANRRPIDWSLAGVATGVAFYFYTGARLTIVVVTLVVIYELISRPRHFLARQGLRPLLGLAAFLVAAGPMLQHAIADPNAFNGRINQVGFIQTGEMARRIAATGKSAFFVMFDQVQHAALAFNFYPDRISWYGLRHPLLDPLFGSIFLVGLGLGTVLIFRLGRASRAFPMVAWWWAGMFIGGALTMDPPMSQRLVTLTVPTCYFVALGMDRIVDLAKRAFPGFPSRAALGIGVVLFGIISYHTYFVECVPRRIPGGRPAEISTEIAPELNRLKATSRIFFLGAPDMYWEFPTLPFLVQNADSVDVNDSMTAPPPADIVTRERGAVYVFLPHRLAELPLVRQSFPEAKIREYRSPVDGKIMVTLLEVPPRKAQR